MTYLKGNAVVNTCLVATFFVLNAFTCDRVLDVTWFARAQVALRNFFCAASRWQLI